jgi:hypothetical protein
MPRKSLKVRRAMLVVTLAMLAVVLAAWGISYWKEAYVYCYQAWKPAPAQGREANQSMDVATRSTILASMRGSLVVVQNNFTLFSIEKEEYAWLARPPGWSATLVPSKPFMHSSAIAHYVGFDPDVNVWGLEWSYASKPDHGSLAIAIPHVLISALLAGSAFWLWFPPHRRAKRLANNQCLRCGYDRKGLAPAAACPECGETPAPAPPAA